MEVTTKPRSMYFAAATLVLLLPLTSGCGLLTTMRWIGGDNLVAAEFEELEGKRVAVVCVSDHSSYGSGSESMLLSREVSALLRENVKGIELVRPDEIADWIDREGWDEIDYREIGRGVKADTVIGIGLAGFSIREGSSLFYGRADVSLTVYDIADGGHEVFRRSNPEFTFPTTGPHPAGDLSEVQFRRAFIKTLSQHVARYFYPYDVAENYSRDTAFIR